jgi:mRNA interferase RelE/StbE
MAYNLLYHPDIQKYDLPKIPRNIQQTIRRAIEERLLQNPFLSGEPLRQSLKWHRKLRVGDYRIIYRVEGKEIIILKIGHRKEVYTKVFSRLPS